MMFNNFEVTELHPAPPGSSTTCLAISSTLQHLLTCPTLLAPTLWHLQNLNVPLRTLRGHTNPVTAAAFSTGGELVTASKERAVLWCLARGLEGEGVVVARELGEPRCAKMLHQEGDEGGWLAIGVGGQVWVIKMTFAKSELGIKLAKVERLACLDCNTASMTDLLFLHNDGIQADNLMSEVKKTKEGKMGNEDLMVATAGEDRTVRIWRFGKEGEKKWEALQQGRHPINCLATNRQHLLAVGDCGGNLLVWQLGNSCSRLVCRMSLSKYFPTNEDGNQEAGCDLLSVILMDAFAGGDQDDENGDGLPSLLHTGSVLGEILSTRQEVLVGTNLGLVLLDLRNRSPIHVLPFTQLMARPSQWLSMASFLTLASLSSRVLCLSQGSEDRRIRLISVTLAEKKKSKEEPDPGCLVISLEDENANIDEAVVTVIPKDEIQSGSALDLDCKPALMTQQSLSIMRKGSLPMEQMRQNIKLWQTGGEALKGNKGETAKKFGGEKLAKSSGYGRDQPKPQKMFQPITNRPSRKKTKKNFSFFASSRLEEPDLMFSQTISSSSSESSSSRLSTSSSEPELSERSSIQLEERRARWSIDSALPRWSSTCSILRKASPPYPVIPHPPTRPSRRLRFWEDSARSQLTFSASGRNLAITGANNSIQVIASSLLLGKEHRSGEDLVGEGQRLVGHKGPVSSADFNRTGDWLASAGEDKVVKLWDWRSRRVIMDVDSKKGGFYEEGYGVSRKVSKDVQVFTEPVTKSRFFYMDSLLLSTSGNKLVVHTLRLPPNPGEPAQYRLVKTAAFPECRTISTLACVNQFYSFLTFLACSDRAVRVFDLNQWKVVREFPKCHPRTTYRCVTHLIIVMNNDNNNNNNISIPGYLWQKAVPLFLIQSAPLTFSSPPPLVILSHFQCMMIKVIMIRMINNDGDHNDLNHFLR